MSKTTADVVTELRKVQAFLSSLNVVRQGEVVVPPATPHNKVKELRCLLAVEQGPRGMRTVRQWRKKDAWGAMKFGTWQKDGAIVVVTPISESPLAVFLHVQVGKVWVEKADGPTEMLADPPCHSRPRAEPETITLRVKSMVDGEETTQTSVNPADPPELVEAYELWVYEINRLCRQLVAQAAAEAVAVTA